MPKSKSKMIPISIKVQPQVLKLLKNKAKKEGYTLSHWLRFAGLAFKPKR